MDVAHKRGRPDATNENGVGLKRSKDEMMYDAILDFLTKKRKGKSVAGEEKGPLSKKIAVSSVPEPSSAISSYPPVIDAASTLRPGTTVTYTDWTQVPDVIPPVSTLIVEEPRESRITINIEDFEEEPALPDPPSPALSYSSEDDRPLAFLLPPNRRPKRLSAQTLVSSSQETDTELSLVPFELPKTSAADPPSSPLDLLVEAISSIPPMNIPETSVSPFLRSTQVVSDSSDPWDNLCQSVQLGISSFQNLRNWFEGFPRQWMQQKLELESQVQALSQEKNQMAQQKLELESQAQAAIKEKNLILQQKLELESQIQTMIQEKEQTCQQKLESDSQLQAVIEEKNQLLSRQLELELQVQNAAQHKNQLLSSLSNNLLQQEEWNKQKEEGRQREQNMEEQLKAVSAAKEQLSKEIKANSEQLTLYNHQVAEAEWQKMDSFQPAIGSKLKPCTKFFSTAGCPYGEGCHFLHYFPGGVQAVHQITGLGKLPLAPTVTNPVTLTPFQNGASTPIVKTRLCNKYSSAEGCKFGERCRFAHGEWELGKPVLSSNDAPITAPLSLGVGRPGFRFEPTPHSVHLAASFGASATAKISVDASLAGFIIGKGGVNTKEIYRLTGAKLSIQDHDSDSSLKNIEMEGTFDQIKQASAMVRDLIHSITSSTKLPGRNPAASTAALGNNFKTKICDNFTRGSCTFGDRCHFAHGDDELRKVSV